MKRTRNKPYVIDLLIFSGMESKNPFVCGKIGVVVVGVVGGDIFPNNNVNPFIMSARIHPTFNNT
jgi:hypothetical protein